MAYFTHGIVIMRERLTKLTHSQKVVSVLKSMVCSQDLMDQTFDQQATTLPVFRIGVEGASLLITPQIRLRDSSSPLPRPPTQ